MNSIDPKDDFRLNYGSAIRYLENHELSTKQFFNERIRPEDFELVLEELLKDPVSLANTIKLNYEVSEEQRRRNIVSNIIKEGTLTILIGAKGHGKTTSVIWLAEYIHANFDKNICWFGYNPAIAKHYPYIEQTYDFKTLPENCILLFDEASIFLDSRDSMSKTSKDRLKNLPTMRHRGISIIFISQSAQSIDVKLFLLCDFIWFKPYFASSFDNRLNLPSYIHYILPQNKNENLVIDMSNQTNVVFQNGMPSTWSDELSKPFSRITNMKDARKLYDSLLMAGFEEREMRNMLEIRGINFDDI